MGCSKSSSKREVYNNIILPQGTRKKSNRQPNFIPKITGKKKKNNNNKKKQTKNKVSRWKDMIKIRAEISEK